MDNLGEVFMYNTYFSLNEQCDTDSVISLNTIYSAKIVHGVIKYKQYIYGSENQLD